MVKINNEPMFHYTRAEGGNAHFKLCWPPVITKEAEPQEGDNIAHD